MLSVYSDGIRLQGAGRGAWRRPTLWDGLILCSGEGQWGPGHKEGLMIPDTLPRGLPLLSLLLGPEFILLTKWWVSMWRDPMVPGPLSSHYPVKHSVSGTVWPPEDGWLWGQKTGGLWAPSRCDYRNGGKFTCEDLITRARWGTCHRARGLVKLEQAQIFLSCQSHQRKIKKKRVLKKVMA